MALDLIEGGPCPRCPGAAAFDEASFLTCPACGYRAGDPMTLDEFMAHRTRMATLPATRCRQPR